MPGPRQGGRPTPRLALLGSLALAALLDGGVGVAADGEAALFVLESVEAPGGVRRWAEVARATTSGIAAFATVAADDADDDDAAAAADDDGGRLELATCAAEGRSPATVRRACSGEVAAGLAETLPAVRGVVEAARLRPCARAGGGWIASAGRRLRIRAGAYSVLVVEGRAERLAG